MTIDRYMVNQYPEPRDRARTALNNAAGSSAGNAAGSPAGNVVRPDAPLHEHYVRAINSALQDGSDGVAAELTVAYRDEARHGMRRAA
jgi:hypothetical protein